MDFVARYGREEFVIILPETALQGAVELATRIRSVIKESLFETPNGLLYVTASIGVSAHLAKDSPDAAQMNLEADQALYLAKRSGPDRVSQSPFGRHFCGRGEPYSRFGNRRHDDPSGGTVEKPG
jgi:diguanylate cyclase (GGDEF)-like protein